MAQDLKYGQVTVEYPGPEHDEPVVVFRAQDELVPKLLAYYRLFCWKAGSPQHHLEAIDRSIAVIEQWQKENPMKVRVPNSNRYAERIGLI